MDLLFRTFRLKGSSTGTFNHRVKNLGVNVFFHRNGLHLSILLIFHKFSTIPTNHVIVIGDGERYLPSLPPTRTPLLIHGVEEFSVVLSGLHLLQKKFHALHRIHRLKDFS